MAKVELTQNSPEKEFKLFSEFLTTSWRLRFKELIKTIDGRCKWKKRLAHFRDLDPKKCFELHRKNQSYDDILKLLKENGAPKMCSVISELSSIDGQDVTLEHALDEISGSGCGSLICCIPGKLGLYYGEEFYHVILIISPDHPFMHLNKDVP